MTIEVIVAAEADENEMGKLASQEPEISPASSRLTQFRSANCTRAGRGFCWLSPGPHHSLFAERRGGAVGLQIHSITRSKRAEEQQVSVGVDRIPLAPVRSPGG